MKKILLIAATAISAVSASAEGYQINNLSSRQEGMAMTGTGMNLGSESLWYNPAAVAMQEKKFDFAFGVSGILPKVEFENGEYFTKTKSKLSTPLHFHASYRINDKFACGLVFNTPNGSAVDWDDNWTGAHINQEVNIKQFNIQPTVAYRILDNLSVGAGMMITWGNFDISKSILPVGGSTNAAIEQMAGIPVLAQMIGNNALASMLLEGSSKVGLGFNVGAFWDINDKWSVGATYRHSITLKVDNGSAELDFIDNNMLAPTVESMLANKMGLSNQVLDLSKVRTELPMPGVISVGGSFRPTRQWEIAADVQYTLWSVYDELRMYLVTPAGEKELTNDVIAARDYKNSFAFRLGAQYHALDWLSARIGSYFDQSPVKEGLLSPETPSMSKIGITAGLTFRPFKSFAIDLAYAHVLPAEGNRTDGTNYVDMFSQQIVKFGGTYKASANTFSIGLRYSF